MMKTFKFFNIIILVMLFITINYQVQASVALRAPNLLVYNNPKELLETDNYDKSASPWIVFSDRDKVLLYRDKNEKKVVYQTDFLEKFKVLKKEKNLIYVEKYANAEIKGWGDINSFIILPHAIKSKHSISHKVILINKFGRIDGPSDSVQPLKMPTDKISENEYTKNRINLLEFGYVYKYFPSVQNAEYVLIGKNQIFLPHETKTLAVDQVILGWVPKQRFIMWKTREGLQPVMDRKHPIYFFNKKEDLLDYYQRSLCNEDTRPTCDNIQSCHDGKNPLTIMPDDEKHIDKKPWPPEMPRYVILEPGEKNEPFRIGIVSASAEMLRIVQHIERENEVSNNVEVMFLFDGTMSMKDYYSLVGNITKQLLKEFKQKHEKIRFGVSVYRDYKDKEKKFEIVQKLTNDTLAIQEVFTRNLSRSNNESKSDMASYYPEAVFQGIFRCINETDWSTGGRRLIVHVGDAGNYIKKGEYEYTTSYISKLLVQNNISYSALQIEKSDSHISYEERAANQLFCKQIRSIIKDTASGWIHEIKKMKNNNVLPDKQIDISKLTENYNQIIESFNGNKCCNTCCDYGSHRWVLTCIKSDENKQYTDAIFKKIRGTSKHLFDVKQQLDTIRLGTLPDLTGSNSTFRPQLMPELIKRLIKRIGNDYVSKINASKEIKTEALQLFSESDIKNISNLDIREKIIYQWGSKKLKKYLNQQGRFYVTSYVRYSHPHDNTDLFKKMILLQRREISDLTLPLSRFKYKYSGQLHPENVTEIFKDFVKAIIGEKEITSKMSVNELYKQQFGISLRSAHKLLSIPYKDIESGHFELTDEESSDLSNYLTSSYDKLKKIYDSSNSFFIMFGHKYVWVEASSLP